MRILVIIPAYNEEENIVKVISSLVERKDIKLDILVVNDFSSDDTGILSERTGEAEVIHHICNLGIGGAVQTGFLYARDRGYDCVIQFDGDGQHLAEELPKLIKPLKQDMADVVIGSRFIKKHDGFRSTVSRRIGIRFFQLLIRIMIRQVIADSTSGFRAYNRASFTFLADHYPNDYPEPEAVILLGRNGFRMREVLTEMQERQSGSSSIRGFGSIYYMIKVSLSMILSGIRPKIRTYE